jgi:pyruvate/2-oxoglutarate dehydrogenase complex dihydrolipoamide acyltransferase (E2) component
MTHDFQHIAVNRMSRAFWTLNGEMNPANKVTFVREVDASAMDRLRDRMHAEGCRKPSYTAIVTKAAVMALQEFPTANRAIVGFPFRPRLVQFTSYNMTVAVERNVPDAEAVVLAETIFGCDNKSLAEITEALAEMAAATEESNPRWRLFHNLLARLPVFISRWLIGLPRFSASLWVKHRGGACFVNSPAKYGIDLVVGDMLWPLTIVFGWVRERPIVKEGAVIPCKTMPLEMIFDRRIMAGAPAAHFFNRLAIILESADTALST